MKEPFNASESLRFTLNSHRQTPDHRKGVKTLNNFRVPKIFLPKKYEKLTSMDFFGPWRLSGYRFHNYIW